MKKKLAMIIGLVALGLLGFGFYTGKLYPAPGDQVDALQDAGTLNAGVRGYLDALFTDEVANLFMNPRNKIHAGVARTAEMGVPQAALQRVVNKIDRAYQVMEGNDLVDLNRSDAARAALVALRAGGHGDVRAILASSNYIITSNRPGHPLYDHVVIIGKQKYPSPWQVTGRYFKYLMARDAIANQGLNRVRVPRHWVYNVPGCDTILNDDNYIVVAEKVRSKFSNPNETVNKALTTQCFLEISEEIGIGLASSVELRGQMEALIRAAGLFSVRPGQLAILGEEGAETITFFDLEWAGFAEYSGFRHIFQDDYRNVRGGDVRAGLGVDGDGHPVLEGGQPAGGLAKLIPVAVAAGEDVGDA